MEFLKGGIIPPDRFHPSLHPSLYRIREKDERSSTCSTSDGSCYSVSSCSLQRYMTSNLSVSSSSTLTDNVQQTPDSAMPYRPRPPSPRSSLWTNYSQHTDDFRSPYEQNSQPSNENTKSVIETNNRFFAKPLGKCSAPRPKTGGTQLQSLDATVKVAGREIFGPKKPCKIIKRETGKHVGMTVNYPDQWKIKSQLKQGCQERPTLPVTTPTKGRSTRPPPQKGRLILGRAALVPLSIAYRPPTSPTTAKEKKTIPGPLMITGVKVAQKAATVALPVIDSGHAQDESRQTQRETKLEKRQSVQKFWRR